MQSYLEEDRHSNEYNWLVNSKSPYLQQHQSNPVNWLEWSPEAFEKAKRENKPIFLSIGYSSCHWCHVMEKESFEDEEVAKLLNKRFISIKVDREERPDIDSIYMKACQALTDQGGWPLSAFLTPDQVPFYTGTYFPKESRYGRPGFKEIIVQLSDEYHSNPEKIKTIGNEIVKAIQPPKQEGVVVLGEEVLHDCFQQLKSSFDHVYGGFGEAPKFPIPHQLMFLLRYYKWTKNDDAKNMVVKTLSSMANGGIYDHIGFGFSRYSVDEMWLVPHFEKMIYDNALLITTYTETYQVTKDERFKKIVQEVIEYIQRDMENADGGYYSAEDADSEGVEGKFYVWSPDEVLEVLGEDLGTMFCEVYDISKYGNFEGGSIPNLINMDLHKAATKTDISFDEFINQLVEAKEKLFLKREKRVHPFKDNKILTGWNSLMIAAMAKAGSVFEEPRYLESAKKALDFIEKNMVNNGRLMVRYREGEVKEKGFLDDYAFLLWAYIEMYEATLNTRYIVNAIDLANQMVQLFWDEEEGAFFFYGNDSESLLTRPKEGYDGAMPSGNSVAALQFARLGSLTGEVTYSEKAVSAVEAFSKQIQSYPLGHTFFLQTVWHHVVKTKEVLIVTNGQTGKHTDLIKQLQKEFYPEVTYMVHDDDATLKEIAPFIKNYAVIDNATTIYVCENFTCNQPTTNIETARKLIGEV